MTGQKSYGMTDVLPGDYANAARQILTNITKQKPDQIEAIALLTENIILSPCSSSVSQKEKLEALLDPFLSLKGALVLFESMQSVDDSVFVVPETLEGLGDAFRVLVENKARQNAYSYALANCG